MKRFVVLVMAVLAICVMAGTVFAADVEGTKWILSYMEADDGTGKIAKMTAEDLGGTADMFTLEFKTGGKVTVTFGGEALEGAYTVEGNTIKATAEDGSSQEYKIDGDNVVLDNGEEGKMVFEKAK
jgi:hypothetical protein